MTLDLTSYSDADLMDLCSQVTAEQRRRIRLQQIPETVSLLSLEFQNCGGEPSTLQAAVTTPPAPTVDPTMAAYEERSMAEATTTEPAPTEPAPEPTTDTATDTTTTDTTTTDTSSTEPTTSPDAASSDAPASETTTA